MSFAVPLMFYFIFIIVRKAIFVRSTLIISNVGFGSGYKIYFPRYETIFIRTKNRNEIFSPKSSNFLLGIFIASSSLEREKLHVYDFSTIHFHESYVVKSYDLFGPPVRATVNERV